MGFFSRVWAKIFSSPGEGERRPLYVVGPIYVDGKHVLTATRDMFTGDRIYLGDVVFPNGEVPSESSPMTADEEKVFLGKGTQMESVS